MASDPSSSRASHPPAPVTPPRPAECNAALESTFRCDNMVEADVRREQFAYQHSSLLGRGASISRATQKVADRKKMPVDLAIKTYWPEMEHKSEDNVLKLATEKWGDNLVGGHIPVLVGSRDVTCSTGNIRDEIGSGKLRWRMQHRSSGPRCSRVLLMRKLELIEKLDGSDFLRVWVDCYRCHFRLWSHGVEHGDISLHNLMYDRNTKCGVLVDLDFAVVCRGSGRKPTGKERTGTIPFMAMDLLRKGYYEGKITRLYRHDLESFIWILPYMLFRGYSAKQDRLLDAWNTRDYHACYVEKCAFLSRFAEQIPSDRNRQVWDGVGFGCMRWFRGQFNRLSDLRADRAEHSRVFPDDRAYLERWESESVESAPEVLKEFEKVIARGLVFSSVDGFDFNPLTDTQMHM